MFSRRNRILIQLALLVVMGGVYYNIIDSSALVSDARQYVTLGYNLAHHGTFSLRSDADSLAPTNYREPGYPAYLAIVIRAIPALSDVSLPELLEGGQKTLFLKYAQIPILLVTAVFASIMVWRLTQYFGAALAVFLLIGLSPSLVRSAIYLNSEHLAALLLLLLSWAFMCFWDRMSFRRAAFVGLSAGLLVLTKAVFLYLLPILFVASILVLWKGRGAPLLRATAASLVLLMVPSFLVGSWTLRNERQLGEFRLASRGGAVLLIRAEKNLMNLKEYFGSFLYWTPYSPVRRSLVNVIYGMDALQAGGALERLNRDNENSYYRTALRVRSDLSSLAGAENKAVDDELKDLAFQKLKRHPFRHLALMFPTAWRGIFVEGSERLGSVGLVMVFLSFAYFLAFGMMFLISFKDRNWTFIAFMLPALYLFGMHAFLTYNLSRFNVPLIPVLSVTMMMLVCSLRNRGLEKNV